MNLGLWGEALTLPLAPPVHGVVREIDQAEKLSI